MTCEKKYRHLLVGESHVDTLTITGIADERTYV